MRVITFTRFTAGSFKVREEVDGKVESISYTKADACFRRMAALTIEGFRQDLNTGPRVYIFKKGK